MEEKEKPIASGCSFMGVSPIMVDLPYPPLQVKEKNSVYASLLSVDYCGSVSELSATTQYINNENRLSHERCQVAKTILGIAMSEMIHLAGGTDLSAGRPCRFYREIPEWRKPDVDAGVSVHSGKRR